MREFFELMEIKIEINNICDEFIELIYQLEKNREISLEECLNNAVTKLEFLTY